MQRRRLDWRWEEPEAQRSFAEWAGFPSRQDTALELDRVLGLVGLETPFSALDVGCGTGRHSLALA